MNKEEQLLVKQDELMEDIDFVLRALQEGSDPCRNVTDQFLDIESFIGNSVLLGTGTETGITLRGDDDETILVQFFTEDKKIWTYLKEGQIVRHQFMVSDTEIDTSMNKIDYIIRKARELKVIQAELDAGDSE